MSTVLAIGKYTLESLTTGMYASPRDLYREYIQNSVDSIDQAISMGIIDQKNYKINVSIDNTNRVIEIEDNGMGIPSEESQKKLMDIGNSSKIYSSNRGFRGIGRLAGLSYCDKLTFTTSVAGEQKKSILVFDCMKLKQLLIPGQYNGYDLSKVLSEVTTYSIQQENSKKHYFKVTMENVEDIDGILNKDEMEDYLCQVAPLPFNKNDFKWGKEIIDKLAIKGIRIREYNLYINCGDGEKQLFKLNSDRFVADKFKRIIDEILNVEIKEIYDSEGNILAVAWYGITNYYGTILDESKKGLRVRKGNILIGDRYTLNNIFKEDRFNGWFQGEVHVISPDIIPNARRDNFEKNPKYLYLLDKLSKIGDELSKAVRNASSTRNDKSNKLLNTAEVLIQKTGQLLTQGFNSQKEKEVISCELNKVKSDIETVDVKDEINLSRKLDLFKQLSMLANNVKGATNFKILNMSQKLTIDQKKLLEKVFDTITEQCEKCEADRLIGEIMRKFY